MGGNLGGRKARSSMMNMIMPANLTQFSEFLLSQANNSSKEYDKIFENKYQTYIKFHFEHLSRNSLNFLKNFVKHYILDKYFLQNYNHDEFELDNIEEELKKYDKYRKFSRDNSAKKIDSPNPESDEEEEDDSSISRESLKELVEKKREEKILEK